MVRQWYKKCFPEEFNNWGIAASVWQHGVKPIGVTYWLYLVPECEWNVQTQVPFDSGYLYCESAGIVNKEQLLSEDNFANNERVVHKRVHFIPDVGINPAVGARL